MLAVRLKGARREVGEGLRDILKKRLPCERSGQKISRPCF